MGQGDGGAEQIFQRKWTMTKITAMYKWSGGTDYRHLCYECKNCKKFRKGSRTFYKCLAYGNTDSTATDWKQSYIACKKYNCQVPEVPVFHTEQTSNKEQEPEIEGQMSFADYPGILP